MELSFTQEVMYEGQKPQLPPKPGKKSFFYCFDGDNVQGPITGDELLISVTHKRIPGTVLVCEEGSEVWVNFSDLPDSSFTPQGIEAKNAALMEICRADIKELEPKVGKGCVIALILIIFGYIIWTLVFAP